MLAARVRARQRSDNRAFDYVNIICQFHYSIAIRIIEGSTVIGLWYKIFTLD